MIRRAKPSEIDKIITITKACASKMISDKIFQWNENYPNKDTFIEDQKRGELYVLVSSEEIIGCITISTLKDKVYEQVSWITDDLNHFYIHRLAVHPNFQNSGNAKKLMDFAENLAFENNIKSIRLDTFSRNLKNQRFYETRGYIKLDKIYFPNQSEHPFYCYELPMNT